MNNITLIGAGGHTRSAMNLLLMHFSDHSFQIVDSSFNLDHPEHINGVSLSGDLSSIDEHSQIFLSVGDNKRREELFEKYYPRLLKVNLKHHSAIVEENTTFGVSNQIFARVYINSNCSIGNNNIINTAAILEHEVQIGNHNHISVNSTICGRTIIGNRCFIGAGSTIIDKIKICDNVTIGAGAVVVSDIIAPGTYVGVPARKI